MLVAAGTNPNTVLQREDPTHFTLDGKYFQALDEDGAPVKPERVAKPGEVRVLVSTGGKDASASFFGDLHPSFAGNVVKAMGSAKQGYPVVSRILAKAQPRSKLSQGEFIASINNALRANVHAVHRLTPNIVEVVIKAPQAARNFEPGCRISKPMRSVLPITAKTQCWLWKAWRLPVHGWTKSKDWYR